MGPYVILDNSTKVGLEELGLEEVGLD